MSRKKVRMIKIILGVYLMIVGILLSIDIYNQKPSNMQFIFVVASIMIIVGFLYVIQDFRKAFEKSMKAKAEQRARIEEEERIRRHQELHSSDKFRTAPMPVVKSVKLENIEEDLEEFDEKSIIITNYEENKSIDTKTTFKEMKVVEEKKKVEETIDNKEKTDNTHKLAIDIAEDEAAVKNNVGERLAIHIEASPEIDEKNDAQAEKEEN